MHKVGFAAVVLALIALTLTGCKGRRSASVGHGKLDVVESSRLEIDRPGGSVHISSLSNEPSRRELRSEDKGYVVVDRRGNVLKASQVESVLRDDEVIEVRRANTGRRVVKIIKASALPKSELAREDLEYTLLGLDKLSIKVEKHHTEAKVIRVGNDGTLTMPLIGKLKVSGLTVTQAEHSIAEKFKAYVRKPEVHVKVITKSPRARILVIGKGFREYEGHERVLDILGAGYETNSENIYDRVCVLRRYADDSVQCILIDMVHMFKYYDFSQNIPIRAGDIIHVRKMPPLLGFKLKWWWTEMIGDDEILFKRQLHHDIFLHPVAANLHGEISFNGNTFLFTASFLQYLWGFRGIKNS